jgi:methionine--tRNA ligase beta chain
VDTIPYADFKKVNLRVGVIAAIEDHPNADKLYVLKVNLGDPEPRQLVAGLRPYYTKEALLGKRIIVVANLQPAVLRGIESNGMLLAAQSGTQVIILTTDSDIPPGSEIL